MRVTSASDLPDNTLIANLKGFGGVDAVEIPDLYFWVVDAGGKPFSSISMALRWSRCCEWVAWVATFCVAFKLFGSMEGDRCQVIAHTRNLA